jgi:glycosyltransferase involved in cell wall biosynthesis
MTTALRRFALGAYVPARTAKWPNASRLFVVGDDFGWSIDDDRDRLSATARRLGYDVAPAAWAPFAERQSVFHHDHFGALRPRWLESSHSLGLSYFHGRPGTAGYPEFDRAYETLKRHAGRIDRVQVTHAEMHELVVTAGVDPAKVHRIPIGVDLENFPLVDQAGQKSARAELGIPQSAFVVGSFVKDGVGLGNGSEPKLVKGPDTLIAVIERLREAIPELLVLLTGPARGYVRAELETRGVALHHALLGTRADLGRAYHALDVSLVASRQEGGPKALLESLAAGVPLVTTRVGQAPELLEDGENGLLADVDDVDALVAAVLRVHSDAALAGRLRSAGRPTAEANADWRLDGRWAALLDGFVQKGALRVD